MSEDIRNLRRQHAPFERGDTGGCHGMGWHGDFGAAIMATPLGPSVSSSCISWSTSSPLGRSFRNSFNVLGMVSSLLDNSSEHSD
jgi:hypothetical protein